MTGQEFGGITAEEFADRIRRAFETGRLFSIARRDGEGDREFGLRLIEAGRELCDKAELDEQRGDERP